MQIIGISENDLINYKDIAMYIAFPYCTFKCNKELGENVCQNYQLQNERMLEITATELVDRYTNNSLQKAVVLGGLEPFDSWTDVQDFIVTMRKRCNDPIVIYTGYYPQELIKEIVWLEQYPNIIIKFGRYVPNQEPHYDKVLGVNLASNNQYALEVGLH